MDDGVSEGRTGLQHNTWLSWPGAWVRIREEIISLMILNMKMSGDGSNVTQEFLGAGVRMA